MVARYLCHCTKPVILLYVDVLPFFATDAMAMYCRRDDPRADPERSERLLLLPSIAAAAASSASASKAPAPATDCGTVDSAASAVVLALENRPNSYGEHDYTPSGEPFHGFTKMEMTAVPSETATIPAGMAIFMERRENAIRMFDQPPAHWARNNGAEVLALNSTAFVGEYFVFQAGIYANS